jgi:murein DD-endopeptidase MepM/ murein hydrolase activator NlpD
MEKMKRIILFIIIFPLITLSLLHFSSPPSSRWLLSPKTPESIISEKAPQELDPTAVDDLTLLLSTTIRHGETIYESLISADISSQQTYSITQALQSIFNPKKSKPGDILKLKEYPDGRLLFEYFPNSLKYYAVEESEEGIFSVCKREIPVHRVLMGAKASIQSSVYESMRKQEIEVDLIYRFTDIFAWEIDFLTDTRKGDALKLIWEQYLSPEGKVVTQGRILAAQYINEGRTHTAIFFKDEENHSDYYTSEGKSLRRSFLRSPLNYRRISSGFSRNRLHPILRIYRPHLGIDYAAPIGTPVWTVADGTVIFVGWNGGYGRYIKIKHAQGIATSYGHLSRYAKGIKKGVKVKQGQTIGYVGSTGLSTGPHLDFRITQNNTYVNFLQTKFPAASSVKPECFDEFERTSQKYLGYLSVLNEYSEDIYAFPTIDDSL